MNKKSITSIIIILGAGVLAGSTGSTGSTIFDRDGKRTGRIVDSPYGRGVDVYDREGNRVGVGRVSPYDDGTLRIFDPRTQQPMYEIRRDRRTR